MDKLLRAVLAASRLSMAYRTARAKLMRGVIAAAAALVGGIFFILALIWFDAALWFYVAPRLGLAIAALIAGGAFLMVTVIAAIAITVAGSGGAPTQPAPSPLPQVVPADLLQDMTGFVRRHQGKILVATVLAGLIFGTSRGRR